MTCDKKNEDYISIISFIIVGSSIMIIVKHDIYSIYDMSQIEIIFIIILLVLFDLIFATVLSDSIQLVFMLIEFCFEDFR